MISETQWLHIVVEADHTRSLLADFVLEFINMVKGRFFENIQFLNAIKENNLKGNTKAEYRRAEVFFHYREMNPYSSVVQPLAY